MIKFERENYLRVKSHGLKGHQTKSKVIFALLGLLLACFLYKVCYYVPASIFIDVSRGITKTAGNRAYKLTIF